MVMMSPQALMGLLTDPEYFSNSAAYLEGQLRTSGSLACASHMRRHVVHELKTLRNSPLAFSRGASAARAPSVTAPSYAWVPNAISSTGGAISRGDTRVVGPNTSRSSTDGTLGGKNPPTTIRLPRSHWVHRLSFVTVAHRKGTPRLGIRWDGS